MNDDSDRIFRLTPEIEDRMEDHMVRPTTTETIEQLRRFADTEPREEHDILNVRQTTHGDFRQNAMISQGIKQMLRASPGWTVLDPVEKEAMDMIALKFSRLLSGKSLELQHWEDIVGYARLAEKECK